LKIQESLKHIQEDIDDRRNANARLRDFDETQAAFVKNVNVGRNEEPIGPLESVMGTVLGGLLPGFFGVE
jgi:hypothetical protein